MGELKHPVLDLVADRFTEIIPPPSYARTKGPDPSWATPMVRVYRPQAAPRVPQEEAPFDADNILGNTDREYGARDKAPRVGGSGRANPDIHQFYVAHLPLSNQGKLHGKPICVVTNVLGLYQACFHVKNIWKPAVYWLQIFDNEEIIRGHTAVIWAYIDRNIELKNVLQTEKPVRLDLYRRFLAGSNERDVIPEFTNSILLSDAGWPSKYDWLLRYQELVRIRFERPEGYWWRQFVQGAEDLIGLIPVVGDVYDAGSVAYMLTTGKAPWTGDRVPRAEALIYAAAAIGPIAVSKVRRLKGFTRGLPRDLAKLSDDAVRDYMEHALGPDFALTVASAATDESMRQLKLQLLAATGSGVRKVKPKDFAEYFSRLLAQEADISTIEKRVEALRKYTQIDKVFVSPRTLQEPLDELYQKYLKRTGHSSDDVTPLEWCRRQTSGRAADLLSAALGPNYQGKLRVLAGSGPQAVRTEILEKAASALSGGRHVDNYKDLHKRTRGLSPVTERDHIFEKRFFLNNPNFSESMDMYENSLSVLVPANQEMLERLRQIDRRIQAPYVHADKRPLMQRLPDGREHEFPLQALWDVHIDTYRQLGVKVTPNGNSFGALVYQELVYNLDYLAADLRDQASILRRKGLETEADELLRKADYRKRFDPKDRAFRSERFEKLEWWTKTDS